jgi:hypothetical protein
VAAPPAPPATPAEEAPSEWRTARSITADEEVRQPEEPTLPRRAANDDRESIGQILRTLQRRPARTSYVTASAFAGPWVLVGLVLGWMYLPELQSALGPSGLTAPVLILLGVVFLVPIIFFYVLAYIAWRSQELRLITQSMAEVAMRLAEPETVARESIVTVGQAIRREVAAMGDGVERALARAAELETLVANEVSALEHARNDNEVRLRALLEDVSAQRDSLVGQAGQTRDAVNSVLSEVNRVTTEAVNKARPRRSAARSSRCRAPRTARSSSQSRPRPPPSAKCERRATCCARTRPRSTSGCARPIFFLQKVLSGAHENMSDIESTLVARVADFVAAMNDVAQKAAAANSDVERNIAGFKEMSTTTINDLSQIAGQFDARAYSLAKAVASLDSSNRQSESALAERRSSLEQLMSTLDSKAGELEERLTRFAGVPNQSLEAAGERAREIARLTAESATSSAQAIRENFDAIRSGTEEERARLGEAMHSIYEQASEESHSMLSQAAQRFVEVLDELKQMSADMRRELEGTRAELRKGILELPQETADATSHMRRVIVDQIEALAELNRIVARHSRSLDAVEPPALRMEPAEVGPRRALSREEAPRTNGNPRGEPVRARSDMTGKAAPVMPRRAEVPSLGPGQAVPGGRTGWLSELLARASHDPKAPPREAPAASPLRGAPSEPARPKRPSIDSLDSLAVEIARMIDHDVAAELWDRYKRGERNVFTHKLYTMQGQKAFDEIRKRYSGDGDFKRTVDRYIGDFERLLEEISREDRGQTHLSHVGDGQACSPTRQAGSTEQPRAIYGPSARSDAAAAASTGRAARAHSRAFCRGSRSHIVLLRRCRQHRTSDDASASAWRTLRRSRVPRR